MLQHCIGFCPWKLISAMLEIAPETTGQMPGSAGNFCWLMPRPQSIRLTYKNISCQFLIKVTGSAKTNCI